MPEDLLFDWDSANVDHIASHRVTPAEAEQVMANDPVDLDFAIIGEEERWTAIGHTGRLRILVIVWTVRDNAIRIVTAWEAPRTLHKTYLARQGIS